MKAVVSCIVITTCLASMSTSADTLPSVQGGSVLLDRSKNVYFDQFSTNTFALQVLKAKNTFHKYDLVFGGSVQIDRQEWHGNELTLSPNTTTYKNGTQVYITQATLDMMPNFSDWATGFLSLADGHVAQGPPSGNDVFLQHAFFVLGNLDKLPFYATVGINTLPFGVFSGSGVWEVPLTGAYFNLPPVPEVGLSYNQGPLNLNASAYSNQVNHQNDFLYSFYFNKTIGNFNYSLGAGYITDLKVDATGNHITSRHRRRVATSGLDMGAVTDFNASIGYGLFSLSAEFDKGFKRLGENREKPFAESIVLTYAPQIAGRTTTFGISRSQTCHFSNVPASLTGGDSLPLVAAGLKRAWGVSVVRNIFTDSLSLGANFEKSQTYLEQNSYTGTIEMFAYL